MVSFKNFVLEINAAGDGGVFGDFSSSITSGDFYAPGDTRLPYVLGTYSRRGKVKKRKKAKSRRKKIKAK